MDRFTVMVYGTYTCRMKGEVGAVGGNSIPLLKQTSAPQSESIANFDLMIRMVGRVENNLLSFPNDGMGVWQMEGIIEFLICKIFNNI